MAVADEVQLVSWAMSTKKINVALSTYFSLMWWSQECNMVQELLITLPGVKSSCSLMRLAWDGEPIIKGKRFRVFGRVKSCSSNFPAFLASASWQSSSSYVRQFHSSLLPAEDRGTKVWENMQIAQPILLLQILHLAN